jgi:hypothetical protein
MNEEISFNYWVKDNRLHIDGSDDITISKIIKNDDKEISVSDLTNIDIENSIHSDDYQQQLIRLGKKDVSNKFTLGPEAVIKALMHAIESNNPKIRYYVTFPTYLFALLKRILPFRVLDKILAKSG